MLVELSFGNFRSFDEEGNPIVATIAVEVGGQEIVSVDKVFSALVYIDDNVDLVSSIDVVLRDSLVDQSHISACFVECRVG